MANTWPRFPFGKSFPAYGAAEDCQNSLAGSRRRPVPAGKRHPRALPFALFSPPMFAHVYFRGSETRKKRCPRLRKIFVPSSFIFRLTVCRRTHWRKWFRRRNRRKQHRNTVEKSVLKRGKPARGCWHQICMTSSYRHVSDSDRRCIGSGGASVRDHQDPLRLS